MLTERGVKILKILIRSTDHVSITALADKFNLSERSIRYDIEKINKVLKSKQLPLIKKVSVGSLALSKKNLIQGYINSLETLYFSSESRQKFMLYKVVLTGSINLTTMSQTLKISRTSVKKDIEEIKETLKTFQLSLQTYNKGLFLKGTENDIRTMQLRLLNNPLHPTKINELLIQPIIDEYFETIATDKLDEFINIIEKESHNIISDQAFNILKNYLMISIKRLKKNQHLKETQAEEHIYLFTPEFDIIQKHINLLEKTFHITFNKQELIKITDLFISSPSYNFPEGFYNYWYEIETFVNRLVREFSKSYDLDLTDDKELVKDLITYLKPILYSEQKRIESSKKSDAYIIDSHTDIYNTIVDILKEHHSEHLNNFNNDDLLAITIYFIASVDRNKYKIKTKKNILVVCGMGYGTSKLVELQLKQKYNVNIVDAIPYHYLKNFMKLDTVDLIVATSQENFEAIDQPVLIVQPHLTKEDFKALENYGLQKLERQIPLSKIFDVLKINYEEHDHSKLLALFKESIGDIIVDDLSPPNNSLLDFLPLDHVHVNVPFNDWKEAIGYAGDLLHKKGYVTNDYKSSLIKGFEKYSSYMLIAEGIGIPHARNNEEILKTGMVLITLQSPVITPSGKNLEVILAFTSVDNVEHLDALSEFSDLLLYSDFKEFVVQATSPEAILNYIKATINNI